MNSPDRSKWYQQGFLTGMDVGLTKGSPSLSLDREAADDKAPWWGIGPVDPEEYGKGALDYAEGLRHGYLLGREVAEVLQRGGEDL